MGTTIMWIQLYTHAINPKETGLTLEGLLESETAEVGSIALRCVK